jgi:hypothetical protein
LSHTVALELGPSISGAGAGADADGNDSTCSGTCPASCFALAGRRLLDCCPVPVDGADVASARCGCAMPLSAALADDESDVDDAVLESDADGSDDVAGVELSLDEVSVPVDGVPSAEGSGEGAAGAGVCDASGAAGCVEADESVGAASAAGAGAEASVVVVASVAAASSACVICA